MKAMLNVQLLSIAFVHFQHVSFSRLNIATHKPFMFRPTVIQIKTTKKQGPVTRDLEDDKTYVDV